MAKDTKAERVLEEGVIITLDDQGAPEAMVRKDPTNGGKIVIYKLEVMGFGDIKAYLTGLTQPPLIISTKEPGA